MMKHQLALAIALLGACSSFDDDVFPHVVTASVSTQPAAPTELASIAVTVRIAAGPNAERRVELHSATLENPDGTHVLELELAFPGASVIGFHADQVKTLDLVNVGTTNADLAPMCGRTFNLGVMIDYPFENDWTGGWIGDVPVTCN